MTFLSRAASLRPARQATFASRVPQKERSISAKIVDPCLSGTLGYLSRDSYPNAHSRAARGVTVLAKRQSIVPSQSLLRWRGEHAEALDRIVAAHRAVARQEKRPRRASEPTVHVYVLLLASKFQDFCRGLHTEMADQITAATPSFTLRMIFRDSLTASRQLDRGNAQPGSIGADFARFEFKIWDALEAADPRTMQRRASLQSLNDWRNAIAHEDFRNPALRRLAMRDARRFHGAASALATSMDRVVRTRIRFLAGHWPW